MNKEIYEKNMKVLGAKFPAWSYYIEENKRKKRNFEVVAENSLMGDTILKVRKDGKELYLNGKYAPAAVVDRWFEKQGTIEDYAPVVIIGISNGEHIKQIMERVPKTCNILIYEPSFELFRRAMQEVDLSFAFQLDIPVGVIVEGLNEEELDIYFLSVIGYDNLTLLRLYLSGNYQELFPEQVEKFLNRMNTHIFNVEVAWNTALRYTSIRAENILKNLHYLYEGYSVKELYGLLPEDVPAIIVAAGPSLNKNIMELKKAVGKACIIATDTAMNPLLNAGIVPNLFVIVDGLKPDLLFRHKDISKVPMVTMAAVSTGPMECHKGKKFFYNSGPGIERAILNELEEKEKEDRLLPELMSGGSVATSAYCLALNMGAKTVILIGQDLAMTGNKTHADGTFKEKMDEIDINSKEYFEVEAVGGGKVLTRADFKLYLDWYEKWIKKWNHITTVDATEGGARIHGSKEMTLKGAIHKYCKREYNVKWHIDHSKKLFTGENSTIALKYFVDAPEKLIEVQKKAKEGKRYYEKLEKLAVQNKTARKEFEKTLKCIKKINHYMETDYMAAMVMESLVGLNYSLRPVVYQTGKNLRDDFLDMAKQGQVITYGVEIAAEEIRHLAENTIVEYAKEHLGEGQTDCKKE